MTAVIDFEERRLEKLPAHELGKHLMRIPAKRRLEMILQRTDADLVVAAMAEQDFYFSVKEIGPDDALPLLALARVDQLNHLFDLEWWQKDRVHPARAVGWLERVAKANDEKLLAWLYQADFELLVTLFKKWFQLSLIPEDMDLLEARERLPKNTLDDQYYWETKYPQYEDFFTRFLSLIFEAHYGFYRELMNYTLSASEIETEEEAYRFHRGRLEDQAIPDFQEALEIYRSIRAEDIIASKEIIALKTDHLSPPSFALALLPEELLLSSALRQIDDLELIDTLQLELSSLANKVVIADQLSPDDPEALHHSVDKVSSYVNIGLHLMSGDALKVAVTILRDVFLEHLFRLGQTRVGKPRSRLQQLLQHGWLSKWPWGLRLLEQEWMEAAELLLQKTPRLLRTTTSRPDITPKEDLFRRPQDLSQAEHFVDVLIALGPLFEVLKIHPEQFGRRLWHHGQIQKTEDVTLGFMIWTAAAQVLIGGKWEVEPLLVTRWPALFPLLKPAAMEEVVRSWVNQILPGTGQRLLVDRYLEPLFQAYEQEMAPFTRGEIPDPRLVRFFLFTLQ